MSDPCGVCSHAAEKHKNGYCQRCMCTSLLPQPKCRCDDGWDWQCVFHGMND